MSSDEKEKDHHHDKKSGDHHRKSHKKHDDSDCDDSKKHEKSHKKSHKKHDSSSSSDSDSDCKIRPRRFHLHLLKGDKGDTGCMGLQGKSGKDGRDGRDGMGKTGKTGEQGPRGHQGCEGPRGKGFTGPTGPTGPIGITGPVGIGSTGPTGPDGIGGLLGYAFATNNALLSPIIPGASVVFDTTDYTSTGILISGSNVTLLAAGTYLINYTVSGVVESTATRSQLFSLITSDGILIHGSNFISDVTDNANLHIIGNLQFTVPDPAHGITTGAGTTFSLVNNNANTVTLGNGSGAVNASMRIQRIA